MEEKVGGWWDKLIRKAAYRGHPKAAVQLASMERLAPLYFRAMGGNPALSLRSTVGTQHHGRRTLLERVAGTGDKIELSWTDRNTLFLPEKIDLFPDTALNRKTYLWLLALSARHTLVQSQYRLPWLQSQQLASHLCLQDMPGMAQIYRELLAAYLPLRTNHLPATETQREAEAAIVQALQHPEQPLAQSVTDLDGLMPVHLWTNPFPPGQTPAEGASGEDPKNHESENRQEQDNARKRRRYRARQVNPEGKKNGPLMIFRAESIFTWDNFLNMNRNEDDEEPGDLRAAEDMEELALARDTKKRSSRLKIDLDLPAAAYDDTPLSGGILLPEWDYRRNQLVPDQCMVLPMLPKGSEPTPMPDHLKAGAHRLRRQFQALQPQRTRRYAQPDGNELDLDRIVRFFSELQSGHANSQDSLYMDMPRHQRSLASLVLADVSLSTEAWVGRGARASSVISVIRDSLMLLAEALQASGDDFALYGFSSLKRTQVRLLTLKGFKEHYDDTTRGRIAALTPGYYTRMGAAIRQCTRILEDQAAHKRLLLLVTDGKPNDLDHYEGRYGLEDTRRAVLEARQAGLVPFCVTIDREAGDYLPHLFGSHHYVVVQDATRLPSVLTRLYAALSR